MESVLNSGEFGAGHLKSYEDPRRECKRSRICGFFLCEIRRGGEEGIPRVLVKFRFTVAGS